MNEMKLGVIESRLLISIWANEPLSTADLIAICQKKLSGNDNNLTVLKRLSERAFLKTREAS